MPQQVERIIERKQIEQLAHPDIDYLRRWNSFLDQIHLPIGAERLSINHPGMYYSCEYGLPGLGANGGLGMLSRDHYLQAVDIGYPGIFFGLAYQTKKIQNIKTDGNGNFWQEDTPISLPTPEQLQLKLRSTICVELNGALGPDCSIRVFEYPLKTNQTKLLLLEVPGEVYPDEPYSDSRLWNTVVLGFGSYQIEKELLRQNVIHEPSVYHLNESATVLGAPAKLDDMMMNAGDDQSQFENILQSLRNKTILTNHTLVPAAEARFTRNQCEKFIMNNLQSTTVKSFLNTFIDKSGGLLGFLDLALHLSGTYNGVSEFHARVAADIFQKIYQKPFEFRAITNGIFEQGWNKEAFRFLQSYGVIDNFGIPVNDGFNQKIDQIPASEMWKIKYLAVQKFREYLENSNRLDQTGNKVVIPKNVLIIADARRVADYKRRDMMFRRPDSLADILIRHPLAHIFISGKAHPNDRIAKSQLSFILNSIAQNPLFKERIHYLPNWDTDLAGVMLPACHVWGNNPRVGEEACGTSGMKTGLGMALQVSTKDGFYAELPDSSYYRISGVTDSIEELDSYYQNLEQAITDSENRDTWATSVKKLWRSGFLQITSGARMIGQYTSMSFSH